MVQHNPRQRKTFPTFPKLPYCQRVSDSAENSGGRGASWSSIATEDNASRFSRAMQPDWMFGFDRITICTESGQAHV
ncbi:MAG: hypothetical protein R3C59_03110 [Planctomycetaceae bacterium]